MNMMPKGLGRLVQVGALFFLGLGANAVVASAQARATVTVDNTRAVPVVVYLERTVEGQTEGDVGGAWDVRLGTVAPHSKSALNLPANVREGERMQFLVHPEGGVDLYSRDAPEFKNGESVQLYVPVTDNGWVPPPARATIPNPGTGAPTLTVENSSDHAATVFAEQGAFDARIGTVPAHRTATLNLPRFITLEAHSVDIFVHVEGGSDLDSQSFDLTPMAHLFVKVPAA
jgi:hypothetical protein